MINGADILVIVILLISAFIGYKRGFVKTLFRFISFGIAIILAISLYKPVANYLKDNTTLDEWITSKIMDKYEENEIQNDALEVDNNKVEEKNIQDTISDLPNNIKEIIDLEQIKYQTKEAISEKVVEWSLNIISMIGIYIAVKLVLSIVCFILDSVMQIPVLKQFNEVLGLGIGGITGLIQIYIIFAIITFLSSIILMEGITSYIKASMFAKILYDNNIIISFLF